MFTASADTGISQKPLSLAHLQMASGAAAVGGTIPSTANPSLTRLEAEEESEEAMLHRILNSSNSSGAHSGTCLTSIRETIKASRACLLLLNLKQYLKEVYGMTDRLVSPSLSLQHTEALLELFECCSQHYFVFDLQ